MSQASSSSTYRLAVSLLIVVLIGLHAVPVLRPSQSRTLWPFMMWAMYKNSSPPGPIDAHTRTMTGTTARGDTLEVTSELVGLGIPAMNRMFGKRMLNGDSAAARRFLRRLNRNREDPVVELRLGGREYLVTDTGVAMEELPVITYRIDPSEARGER